MHMILLAVAIQVFSNYGWLPNNYCSDPNLRMTQLSGSSEPRGQIDEELGRFWRNTSHSHMTPNRIDGGIQ